jgi:hypothetical protein
VFDAGALTANENVSLTQNFSGFPNIALSYPSTLYVTYGNLQGSMISVAGNSRGGEAVVYVYLNGSLIGGNAGWIQTAFPGGALVSPASGTIAISLPAGTNLSQLDIVVGLEQNLAGTTPQAGMVAGHIEIAQIWVQ